MAAHRQYLPDVLTVSGQSKPIGHSSRSHPLEAAPDLTWMTFYFQQCCQTPATRTHCAAGQTDKSWRYSSPYRLLNRLIDEEEMPKAAIFDKPQVISCREATTPVGLRPIASTHGCTGRGGGQGWREPSHCTCTNTVGDEYTRTSLILNKRAFFCLTGK